VETLEVLLALLGAPMSGLHSMVCERVQQRVRAALDGKYVAPPGAVPVLSAVE
jgi:hypothetical protein